MKLLDKFRSQPEWQSPDPATRAAAVRALSNDEGTQDLLVEIARNDADPLVRQEAVVRLEDLDALVSIIGIDDDASVRVEAEGVVRELVIEADDHEQGERGLGALSDDRALVAVARSARLESLSRVALSRLDDPKALGSVARLATNAGIAREALLKLDDPRQLETVAVRSEDKTVALLAFDRLAARTIPRDVLELIGKRARQRAVQRRARVALSELDEALTRPDPTRDHLALCDEVEAIATELDLDCGRQRLDALLERWSAVDTPTDGAVIARFAAGRECAESHLVELEASKSAKRKALQVEQEGPKSSEALEVPDVPADPQDRDGRNSSDGAPVAEPSTQHLTDLETTLASLEHLVESGTRTVPKKRWMDLDEKWCRLVVEYSRLGDPDGMVDLDRRRAVVDDRKREIQSALKAERLRAEQENVDRLQQRCSTIEGLLGSEKLKLAEAERQLRAVRRLVDEPGRVPSRDRESITRRLKQAQIGLSGRVRELRDFADWQRWANLGVQEKLCRQMEALANVTDEVDLVERFRDIMLGWRQASDVPKDRGAELWERFKKAHEAVNPRCQRVLAKQAIQREATVARQQAIVEETERLSGSTDWLKTVKRITELQAEWKSISLAPRREHHLWNRFRTACNTFFTRRKADLAERKQEWARNLAAKETLSERVEALAEADDLEVAVAEVKKAQAEWKTVGAVRRTRSEAIWQRFQTACDRVFDRVQAGERAVAADRVAVVEGLCEAVEALLPDASRTQPPADLAEQVHGLQERWREAPVVSPLVSGDLMTRFGQGVSRLVEAFPEAFRGTDLDPERHVRRLEKLCERIEALKPASGLGQELASPAEVLATKWREALASNLMGDRVDEAAERREAMEEVKRVKQDVRRMGTLPGETGRRLAARFHAACEDVLRWAGPPKRTRSGREKKPSQAPVTTTPSSS